MYGIYVCLSGHDMCSPFAIHHGESEAYFSILGAQAQLGLKIALCISLLQCLATICLLKSKEICLKK